MSLLVIVSGERNITESVDLINRTRMNVFQKIKEIIADRKFQNQIYDDIQNLDEVLLQKRLEIFKEKLTPEFIKIGLNNWNGKYIWSSDFNKEGVKHVVEYNVLKGYGGSFSYGNCFYSMPTISGEKKLIYHKTDKSTKIHLYRMLDGWQESFENNIRFNLDRVSTANEKRFRSTLDDILVRNIPKLESWFVNTQNIEDNIKELKAGLSKSNLEKGQRIISNEYILSFLYKEKKDIESALYWIDKHFEKKLNNEIIKNLLLKKLKI